MDAPRIETTVAAGSCTMDSAGTATTVPAASSRRLPVAGSSTLVAAVSVAWVSAVDRDVERVDQAKPFFDRFHHVVLRDRGREVPSIVAVPLEKNCTVEPSASDAVTPFRLTEGSVTVMVDSAPTTISPYGCVSAAGDVDSYVVQQTHRVARPSDRDHRCGECIFEQQQRAHDPGAEFADGRVRVRVGGAGDRQHRGELGVTQSRECADDAREDERQDDGGSGVLRSGRAGAHENTGADDAADAEQDQVDRDRACVSARRDRIRFGPEQWTWYANPSGTP